jgi:hypothetical protein
MEVPPGKVFKPATLLEMALPLTKSERRPMLI